MKTPKCIIAIDPGTVSWGYAIFYLHDPNTYKLNSSGVLKIKPPPKDVENHYINRLPSIISSIQTLFHGFTKNALVILEEPPVTWSPRARHSLKATSSIWCAFGVFYATMYNLCYPVLPIPAKGFTSKGTGSDEDAAVRLGKYYIQELLEMRVKDE